MPSFVIVPPQRRQAGKTIDAIICSVGASGYPDDRTAVPIKATILEKAIRIDGEARHRSIISSTGMNGTTTFLVNGSTQQVRNRERRAALSKALAQLQLLAASLRPRMAVGEEPEPAFLFNWISDERERLTEGPHHG